jgi:16S rRNA (guanine527-N7)-methyltransferase
MNFAEELTSVLHDDIPRYSELITKAALHLERIVEANQSFNLTRIISTREAVIKHVLDSVLPWKLFAGATHILDAGTGAGFPGIPLAIVLLDIRFILSESVGKKARFVEAAVAELGLANIEVRAVRAEEILLKSSRPPGSTLILTGRAIAPVSKAAALFAPGLRQKNTRALFYKGPGLTHELAEAAPILKRHKLRYTVLDTYQLPDQLGSRSILEIAATDVVGSPKGNGP